jgi:hypothetical protein
MPTPVEVAAQEALDRHFNRLTQEEMDTVAKAVRILSLNGLMSIKLGKTIVPADENSPIVGPLTPATLKSTGEEVFLWCDSGLYQTLDSLEFRMTVKAPKAPKAMTPKQLARAKAYVASLPTAEAAKAV